MANITLARVDHRLIHGQVITKWQKIAQAKKIIIIDDYLAKESFMVDIYKMAAPPGVSVEIHDTQKASQLFLENKLGDEKIFILFKNVEQAKKAFDLGFAYNNLQLGGIPSAPGKRMIFTAVSLDQSDIDKLVDLQENGVDVNLHIVPEEASMSLDNAIKKFNTK